MNYFEYNANKHFPKGQSSKATYQFVEAPPEWRTPSNFEVTEHAEFTREMWDALAPVPFADESDARAAQQKWRDTNPKIAQMWQKVPSYGGGLPDGYHE